MDWSWRLKAACDGVPVEQATWGDVSAGELKEFISKYCDRCEVWQQCWDNRIVETDKGTFDDNEWTVRGGRLPFRSSGENRGRPKGSPSLSKLDNLIQEDPDRYLNTLLKWHKTHPEGVCVRGHRITDEFTQLRIRFRENRVIASCLMCDKQTGKKATGKPKALPTHCRKGHEYTKENTTKVLKTEGGKTREFRRCRTCQEKSNRDSYNRVKGRGKIAA